MLCWALVEQARHEHKSDEYKKTVYYHCVAVAHILSLPEKHKTSQVVYKRTNQRGECQADEQVSQIHIVDRNY